MPTVRTCTSCKVEKPATAEYFHAGRSAADGLRAVCKMCRASAHEANREAELLKRKAHYQANKEKMKAAAVAYYHANVEKQRTAALKRHYANRDKRIEQQREYRAANLEDINERRRPRARAIYRERYGSDLAFTLKHRMRSLLRVTLTKGRQGRRMAEVLGYTQDELKAHLERQFTNGMSWDRFMAGEIHIDHIIPVASFGAIAIDTNEFRQCWALANLRPTWAKDNLSKQDKVLTLL